MARFRISITARGLETRTRGGKKSICEKSAKCPGGGKDSVRRGFKRRREGTSAPVRGKPRRGRGGGYSKSEIASGGTRKGIL